MVQIFSGLITCLLLAIYCQEQHGEHVPIHRVRHFRNQIRIEAMQHIRKQRYFENEVRRSEDG